MKLQIYTEKGAKSGNFDFPKEFDVKENINLLSQAFYVYEDRSHKGTSKVKTRSEVNATRAKMYKQKGTGGARHGDKKAPIFTGGGIAHGPKGLKRTLRLSQSQKERSLGMALARMAKEGKIVIVDKVAGINKTKEANELLNKICAELNLKRPSKILMSLSGSNKEILRNFRNIEDVRIVAWSNLNTFEVLSAQLLITEKEAIEIKQKNKGAKKQRSEKTEKLNKDVEVKTTTTKSVAHIQKAKNPSKIKNEKEKTTKAKTVRKTTRTKKK